LAGKLLKYEGAVVYAPKCCIRQKTIEEEGFMNENKTEGVSENRDIRKQNDRFMDIVGLRSEIPLTKGKIICIIVAIATTVACVYLPLDSYGDKAGIALGLTVGVIILMLGGICSCGPAGAIFCFAAIVTGTLDMSVLTAAVGGGLFFQFVGLCIVGYGIEATPFGSRLAYIMLKVFGKNPKAVVVVILVATAVLSSLISNFATLVLMSAMTHKILTEIGHTPGSGRFGAACMLAVVAGASVGGIGFLQGSIGINMFSINAITTTTVGKFTITAGQWAAVGWITLILLLPCVAFIYLKCIKFDSKDVQLVGSDYYQQKLSELGAVGGSEWRWIIMIVSLVVLMIMGFNTVTLMLIYIFLAVCPGIGIVSTRDGFAKAIPWEVVFSCATTAMITDFHGKQTYSTCEAPGS
jgi:di/tricarboxylate transporter